MNVRDKIALNKKYRIIYADPPWPSGRATGVKRNNCANRYYPLMSWSEIYDYDVKRISADNCALFLWTTFPLIKGQLKVFDQWGFRYVTVAFTWIKTNKINKKPCFSTGHYTKSNAECCLLGIRGSMKVVDRTISSVILANRREHSRKPDEVRDKIVQLFGDLPRIELFARQKISGWDCSGDEV